MTDVIIYFLMWGAVYFLPTIIAAFRHKKNGVSIFIVNFFFGWTIIAWVICLAWACAHEKV